MQHEPQKFLRDMLDRAEFVTELLASRSVTALDTERVLRSAVERELMVLGEALYQLHRLAPNIAEQIDRWDDIIGFRHILVHGYAVIDMQIVWDIVTDDLPVLIRQVRSMLAEME
jgi:uncharacterized protein with HEPN domain